MADAVDRSLGDLPHKPRDLAALELLRTYADLLDDAIDRLGESDEEENPRDFGRMVMAVSKIGPRLEAMLDRLGMAPGARPSTPEGDAHGDPDAAGALDQLEQDAAARADGLSAAPLVDPAVTAALAEE